MTANVEALPVLAYSTGAGWQTLGKATSLRGAASIAMRHLGDEALSLIKNHGFTLQVFRRTELQLELNGGPDGYVYSVGKIVPRH